MTYQFKTHYTLDQARSLLPSIRQWLAQIAPKREVLERLEKRFGSALEEGNDLGGVSVNEWISTYADLRELLWEFGKREIQIKDLERGLIDFPAIIDGREVFLCWEQGEEDIEFWHELSSGYAGRERI